MTKLQRSLMLLSLISFGVIQTKAETIVDNSKGNLTKVSDKNGITVVDIDSPNEKGISVNNFTKFEVTNKGMVLNNSNTRYKTTFGVEIEGNKNLLKKEADIALLRVTGVESSKLSGKLEAASVKELDVFLANRNGIVIDGLTLENINRAVFTTGNITDDLKLFVNSGKIHITDKGLRGAGSIDLITYNLINQGKVSARDEININLGINRFDLSKKSNINTKEYEKLGKELNLKLNETTLTILGNLKSILDQRNEVLNKAILQPTSDVKIMAERRAKFFELNEKIMKYASLANETGLDLSVVGINIFDNGFISADMVKFNKIYKVIKDKNIEGIENLLNPVKDTASKYEFDKLTKDLGVKINEKTINAIAALDYLIKEENAIISRVVLKFDTLTNNDKEKIKKDLAKLKVDIKSTLIFARENGVNLDNIGINLDSKGDVVYKDRNKFASVFNSIKKLNGLEQLFDTKGTLIYSNNKVDASQLGSMYSNKIKITSPDKWLNVETKEILAKNSINIDIKGDVLNKGAIEANNLVDIKANKLENIGSVDFSKGGYEVKWITRDGKVLSLDDINKVWNKKYGYNLTEEDTWLLMSGKLLNAWTYDVNFTKDKARSIYNRFNDVLNQLNAADKYTVLTREGKEIVRNKNIDKTFVNKGDIYATELDNQRILEAFAVSKTNAKQASIVSNDVNINLSNDLINRDAKIVANSNLNIKANKIENKNTLSGDILLKDGYETVSWDVIQKMYQGRVIGAERYEINYERGLKEDKDARKTKVSAINKSIISGNNINIEAKNIKLVDEKNTGSSINSKNTLVIKTDVLEMNGQNVEATKSVDITAQNINIKDSGIYSSDVKLTSNKLSMTSKKEKEIVLRTDKELLTREYVLGSTIDANKNISLNVNELELKGAVIRADENISLKGNKLDLLSEKIVKDYKSAYSISKSFRTVKNNERLEQIVGSYITGKNINIAYKNLTTKASGILSSNNIGVNGNNVNLGTSVVKYELDKRIGIDNGILGINYKNIQKNIESTVGSVVLSKGDISVKVDKEFNLSGSKIKGHKVDIEASNVNINSTKDNSTTKTESRNLLGGDLTGSAEYNKTDTNISAKVDMEIYKKEKEVKKEEKNNKSIVEGENVNINAKKDVNIKGSDIKGGDVKISGENVNVTSKEIKKEIEKDSVSHNISVGVSAGVGEKGNSVAANVDYKVKHENTKTSETKNEASSISGENVTITGNNVNVKGSEVSAKDKVDIKGNVVNISNDIDKANVTKTLEELGIKLDVNVREKTLGIIGTVKKLIDERNNLLGYVLNPVAGYNKAIEYEKKLEDNLETIKKTVSEIQKNGISPETLGLELTASGEVKYTMEKINIVENAIKSSVIKAKNITVKADKVNITGSKVEGGKVNVITKDLNMNGAVENTSTNKTNVVVEATGSHDFVKDTTTGGVSASTNVSGNNKSKVVEATIKADEVNVKVENDANLTGANIKADKGEVTVGKNLNVNNVNDKEVKYSASIGAEDTTTSNPKVGANGSVEYISKNENKSGIDIKEGTVTVKGNKNETNETSINAKVNGSISNDGDNTKVTVGATTKIEGSNDKVSGKAEIGLNLDANINGKGKVENSNISSKVDADVNIKGDGKVLGDTNISINSEINGNSNGITSNNKGKINTEVNLTGKNVEGKVKLGAEGNLGVDEKNNISVDGKGNANGTVTIKGETENVSGNVTLNGNLNVAGGKGKETTSDVNANANGKVVIKGETEHVNGNLTFTGNGEFAANNKDGVTKAEGTGNANGTVTIKGETENVAGNVTLNGNLNVAGGKGKETTSDVNSNANGKVVIKGETEHVNGNLTFTGNGEFAANNKDGVTKAEVIGSSNGEMVLKNTGFNKINNKISDLHLTLLTNKVKLNKNNLKEIKISLENGEEILVDNEIDSK